MPHIVVEYSANLEKEIAASELTQKLHKTVVDSGIFSPDAVKARSVKYDDFVLTSAKSFIHITTAILTGRSVEQRAALSGAIFKTVKENVPQAEKISSHIREMCAETYRK